MQVDHGTRTHHRCSISRLNAVADCAGFTSTDGDTLAAEEGERLHELMDRLALEVIEKRSGSFTTALAAGLEGVSLDDEEFGYLWFCCNKLDSLISQLRGPLTITREERVSLLAEDGQEVTNGHYDLCLASERFITIVDYKFGRVPVPPANKNLQGKAYLAAVLQKSPQVPMGAAIFIQPKLNSVSSMVMKRAEIKDIVHRAWSLVLQSDMVWSAADPDELLRVGQYCAYCAKSTVCPRVRGLIVRKPDLVTSATGITLNLERIQTPEDAARAHYACKLLETALPAVRARCLDIARANGGSITGEGPDGPITMKVAKRNHPRVLGDTPQVIAALCEALQCKPEDLLPAAEFSLDRLMETLAPLAKADDPNMSNKAAVERITGILEAHGLLSKPDGFIEYLKSYKSK